MVGLVDDGDDDGRSVQGEAGGDNLTQPFATAH